jgi:hypothetical protein
LNNAVTNSWPMNAVLKKWGYWLARSTVLWVGYQLSWF